MKQLYDVQQLLKRFGTIIYTGNYNADLELMFEEVRTLFQEGLLEASDYRDAILIIKTELGKRIDGQ
jgi:uncharacterized protein YqgQ